MSETLATLIILSLIGINTGFSYEAPFASPKSVVTLVVLIVVWVLILVSNTV